MRVAIVAFYVRGAMGHYLDALIPSLSLELEIHLFVPSVYDGNIGKAFRHEINIGNNMYSSLLRLLLSKVGRDIWNEILEINPDIIHIFSGEGSPWSLYPTVVSPVEIPVLLTVHDPSPHPGSFVELVDYMLKRRIIPRVRSVHIHSSIFREALLKLGARKVVIIPHGSIADRFLKYRRGIPKEPVILFFGRIAPYKGLDVLIEATNFLREKMKVVIAGPGKIPRPLLKYIERHPETFEVHNRYLSDREVAALFERASVLVLPYKHATQSSLPLIAAAFGVPVVASAIGAFLEDVPRVGGILVPPRDPASLARGILKARKIRPRFPRELRMSIVSRRFLDWYTSEAVEDSKGYDVHKSY